MLRQPLLLAFVVASSFPLSFPVSKSQWLVSPWPFPFGWLQACPGAFDTSSKSVSAASLQDFARLPSQFFVALRLTRQGVYSIARLAQVLWWETSVRRALLRRASLVLAALPLLACA